ncbi:hypothetical protein G7K71_09440 [Desulfofundulus sp. TPOSR]|uniref:hypothetical protein n=1 Tax=Desulfofundulus sp. TPOSR TaxID=2714340 RepID=UPI00140A2300|nr:hypothetical protein [Desulfofundulus sp. TPOSR]NHM27204.1 hypothetical protein [Desulfofundulus sp. TPOSR]
MATVKVEEIDLTALEAQLDKICQGCDLYNSAGCKESQCLVGFARKVLSFAAQKKLLDIPGASKLLPTQDFKPYYPEQVAGAIAETCRQCRQCRDNHSPDCVIALVRSALESALLQETIDYPGSVFLYLARIKEQHSQLAALLARELQKGRT